MTDSSIKPTRAYPSLPEPGNDTSSHSNLLRLMKEGIQIHERRTSAWRDSFVRLGELVDLGILKVEGDLITIGDAVGSGLEPGPEGYILATIYGEIVWIPYDGLPIPSFDYTGFSPDEIIEDEETVITVTGTGFTEFSTATFDGQDAAVNFISDTEIQITVTAAMASDQGAFVIEVTNPAPGGGSDSDSIDVVGNPVPVLISLSPDEIEEDESTLTVTITGTGFVPTSQARWEGSNRTTTYIDPTELEVEILDTDITAQGTFQIDVVNPTPGGGTSNELDFDVVPPGDAFFEFVDLLMHCEGTNGAEGYVDSSWVNRSLVSGGTATLHTNAQQKFGATSVVFPGTTTSDGILVENSDYGMGLVGDDFTIEFFVRFNSATPQQTILAQYSSTDGARAWWVRLKTGNFLEFAYSTTGFDAASVNSSQAWAPSTGQWYHVAVVRNGADLKLFIDGTQIGSTHNIGSSVIHNSVTPWRIGGFFAGGGEAFNNTQPLDGWLDEIRVTRGVARYTANFTPPAAAFLDFDTDDILRWDPATGTVAHMRVTDGGRSVVRSSTNNTSFRSVRGTIGKSTGKWYWEYKILSGPTATGEMIIGAATSAQATAGFPGDATTGRGYQSRPSSTPLVYNNGSSTGPSNGSTNYVTNDVVGVALDMTGNTLDIYINNVLQQHWTGIPAGTWYPCAGFYATGMKMGFQNTLTYSPPSGYSQLSP